MIMDCGLMIKNIDRCLAKKANVSLMDDDITFSQLRFVSYIYEKEGQVASMKEMERFYEVAQPTVAGIMKRLERKGFIVTTPDPQDRRAKNAALTDKGRDLLERQEMFRQRTQDALLEPLSPEEKELFMDMLERVWLNLKEEEGDDEPPDILIKGSGIPGERD